MFEIATAKSKLSIDLLLNTVLLVCQLFRKTQLLLVVFNCPAKQLFRLLALGVLRLLEIATAKPRLGIDLLLKAVLLVCQLLGKAQLMLEVSNGMLK